jgi:hypothetical protein
VPAGLAPDAPALVLAVAGNGGAPDVTAQIASVIRVDNPALDVRVGWLGCGADHPASLAAVLAAAAGARPAGGPAAVVVPLLAVPHPPVISAIRPAVAGSGVNATVAEPFDASLTFAEALHIRLADARLARADRVRMFSIPTAADGIIVATAGGAAAAAAAAPTAVLLAARLALPVFAAALDGTPSIAEAAAQLRQMGARRIAIAPCIIGPEARPGELETACASIGADCAAPLGAHDSVARLMTLTYGQALAELDSASGAAQGNGAQGNGAAPA